MGSSMAEAMGIEPCPMCGSGNVRWRGRRPWDFLFTWLRYGGEIIAQALTTGTRSTRSAMDWRPEAARWGGDEIRADSQQIHADLQREHVEARTGLRTPKRFWKCRDCGREGHEFA